MKLRTTACVFVPVILMLLTTIPVLGGVVPGRWEKVDSLEPGAGIVVSLGSGEKMVPGALHEVWDLRAPAPTCRLTENTSSF